MSYRIENKDIVIDGWENGIAESPYAGITDIRSANIDSYPGEASVGFATSALTKPPTVSALAFTVETTDILTVASTSGWYNGMAVTLNSLVNGTGLATGRVYWVGNLSGATFKLYKNPARVGSAVDITLAGSGTLSSYTLSQPLDDATAYNPTNISGRNDDYYFILDSAGLVWWVDTTGGIPTSNLVYLGNDTITGTVATGRGISIWKNYLIVARAENFDAIYLPRIEDGTDTDSANGWTYGWDNATPVVENPRPMFVGQDEVLYYANSKKIGSFTEASGSTFDPTNGATWSQNISALDIPPNDDVLSLSELGTNLLIGGRQNKIYPWDRISSSFFDPIRVPEFAIRYMVPTNSVVYVFAGYRGNIYVTNGSSLELYKKIPDSITEKINPFITITSVGLDKDKLYFGFTAEDNSETTITGVGGIWAINLTTKALRLLNRLSYGVSGAVHTISRDPFFQSTLVPDGNGLFAGWSNSSTYGVDKGSSDPYVAGETILTSDIIPIGSYTFKETPSQIEYKLGAPLVSGESVELLYRSNINTSFTTIFTSNTAGLISEASDINFENVEWLQIRAILTSTATTPSFTRLREIRIRL